MVPGQPAATGQGRQHPTRTPCIVLAWGFPYSGCFCGHSSMVIATQNGAAALLVETKSMLATCWWGLGFFQLIMNRRIVADELTLASSFVPFQATTARLGSLLHPG